MRKKLAFAIVPLLLLTTTSVALALQPREKGLQAMLDAGPEAVNAGLENAVGVATVLEAQGIVQIRVDTGGASLPAGSVLEGWVVDAGLLGGPGTTSVSDDDEVYGTPFGNASFDQMVENSPYALSTGVLDRRGNHFAVEFRIANNLTPYDAVVVTLESDGNGHDYDPRPGSIIVAGPIQR